MPSASPDASVVSERLRVVYVAGSSHSGSTLLSLLASQHPRVASVGEASVKPRIRREGRAATQPCSCGETLDRCPFWSRVFQRVSAEGLAFGPDVWSNDYRFEHPWLDRLFTRETSVRAVRRARQWAARSLPGYRQRVRRIDRVNVAFIRAVLAETGADVFVDTTKLLTRLAHLLAIDALDVKVVWLTRDARGVAYSARRRGESVDAATRVWTHDQEAIATAVSTLPLERHTHVRYEDLCRDPGSTLARLWAFCGVEAAPGVTMATARQHHVLGNRMRAAGDLRIRADEAWREGLSEGDLLRICRIAGAMNRQLGYDCPAAPTGNGANKEV